MAAHVSAGVYEHPATCPADPDLRASWGCDGMLSASAAAAYEVDGQRIMLERCPLSSLTQETCAVLSFYPWLESGSWPVQGGVLDQSATFVHAVRIYSSEINRIERKRVKDAEERNGR